MEKSGVSTTEVIEADSFRHLPVMEADSSSQLWRLISLVALVIEADSSRRRRIIEANGTRGGVLFGFRARAGRGRVRQFPATSSMPR